MPGKARRRYLVLAALLLNVSLLLSLFAPVTAQGPTINNPAPDASAPDGIYTPFTNRQIYQLIASDYQEIVSLTNQVLEGRPLPSAEILAVYEQAKHARVGTQARILRDFGREPARTAEFPAAAAFYNSPTFLDDFVIDAILGIGTAERLTEAQRRQAIQKGVLRIIYAWSAHYLTEARASLNPGLVDEAWAIYMGVPVDGRYPNSLSATAAMREENYGRPGTVDAPLREAMNRAQRAAANQDAAGYAAAERDAHSRYNAIFYLGAARYLHEPLRSMAQGLPDAASVGLIEGLSFYRTIQPTVAAVDPDIDATMVSYYTSPPASLTTEMRNNALASLNRAADALLLRAEDLVTPATFA